MTEQECDELPAKRRSNNPRGRPRSCNWDDPAIQTLALQAHSVGLNIIEVCSLCHSSEDSFYRWLKKNPDFSQRLNEARAKRKTHALNSAYNRAFPPANSEKRGDTPMAMFLLRTQFGLREEPQTVVQIANVSDGAKPKEMKRMVERMPDMSDEELMRIAGGQAALPPGQSDVVDVEDVG